MDVLIDSNVAIDVLLYREPSYQDSHLVLLASERRLIHGYISASAITDIFYIISKKMGKISAREIIVNYLIGAVSIATVDESIVYRALDAKWNDFEDSVQYTVGKEVKADFIVTRNVDDFKNGTITTIEPEKFVKNILFQ